MTSRTIDWQAITPREFEALCSDILKAMGFDNIRHVGGSGDKGRDILCSRTVPLPEGISLSLRWVIQCKHRSSGIGKALLLDDLAAATEHSFDFWWLMTSAEVTPGVGDWLRHQERTAKYPFGIDYLDRHVLDSMLGRFPHIQMRHFPDTLGGADLRIAEATSQMHSGHYAAAVKILSKGDDDMDPRFPYLLACCHSMLATRNPRCAEDGAAEALCCLTEAATRGYVDFICEQRQWPRDKCLYEIHRDEELHFIREGNARSFERAFPKPESSVYLGGGGCLSGNTLVQLADGSAALVRHLLPGQLVLSGMYDNLGVTAKVAALYKSQTAGAVVLNRQLTMSYSQPVCTIDGWREAVLLECGDLVLTQQGPKPITSVEYLGVSMDVFDVALRGNHQYFANGYLVHNKLDY